MATMRLASFDNKNVIIEADYHDGNRRVQVVRCINSTTRPASTAVVDGQTVIAQVVFQPGTTQQNIAQGKQITIDQIGDIDFPYTLRFGYPV